MISCSEWQLAWNIIPQELGNTLYMVGIAGFASLVFGLPIGVILNLTARGGLAERNKLYQILGFVVNIGRSIPFAILIIAVFPLTRFLVGTTIGTTASIVPLTIAAIPFMARVVESALNEVDRRLIESAIVMGSTTGQIISKLLIPESLIGLIRGVTLTLVNLIGYSAMAGLVGGGGLGKVAIQYGYQRFNGFLMLITLSLLLLLVEGVQWLGNAFARWVFIRRGGRP